MKTQEQIIEYLKEELNSIYCQTCQYEDCGTGCDGCNRKQMLWQPSESFLKQLSVDITEG